MATHYITEWETSWPKEGSKDASKYSIELVGSKHLICRTREVMKYFYGNIDKNTYDINGVRLGMTKG